MIRLKRLADICIDDWRNQVLHLGSLAPIPQSATRGQTRLFFFFYVSFGPEAVKSSISMLSQ